MVLEGVILSERGKEPKQMEETKIRGSSKKIWMRRRSRERMVDEWNKQKCMKRADNRATDIDLQSSFWNKVTKAN